ncbi:alpha/beta fold hydrolase [Nocardia altamirensis]|uniref:alpha/beta fold hydrolase n=1 Tax=Nocardia altamirensis TaxID=472158 RepID=UPI0008400422|nr:alpha/beta hydrolase [Nocardia altamirensis]
MANEKKSVRNGSVALPITRSGAGQPVVFFNGIGATQASWKNVVAGLTDQFETITFDFRGHGKATSAGSYTFGDFLSDAETVMDDVLVERPIIVGWSLGADLAVAYAAKHPKRVGALVLVDGAVPIQGPLVQDEAAMRNGLNSFGTKFAMWLIRATPYGYHLPPKAIADLTLDVDERRQHLLDTYATLTCPTTLLVATNTAEGHATHTAHVNETWRAGAHHLHQTHPDVTVRTLDATHKLPFTHPIPITEAITDIAQRLRQPE